MSNNYFQDIFDELQTVLPEEWKKVVFYAEYALNSYSMKFFVGTGRGKYLDCYDIPELRARDIDNTFRSIHKILTPIRKSLSKKDTWTVLTMVIDRNGKFKADYDYSSHDKILITWESAWRKKYLK